MSDENCEGCKFWKQFKRPGNPDYGICRRYPPAPKDDVYPISLFENWCGEFQAKTEAAQ